MPSDADDPWATFLESQAKELVRTDSDQQSAVSARDTHAEIFYRVVSLFTSRFANLSRLNDAMVETPIALDDTRTGMLQVVHTSGHGYNNKPPRYTAYHLSLIGAQPVVLGAFYPDLDFGPAGFGPGVTAHLGHVTRIPPTNYGVTIPDRVTISVGAPVHIASEQFVLIASAITALEKG